MCCELRVSAVSRNNSAMCGPCYPDCHLVLFCPAPTTENSMNEILTLSFIVSYMRHWSGITSHQPAGMKASLRSEDNNKQYDQPRLYYKQWISVILAHSPGFSFITDFVCNFQIFYYSKENWITAAPARPRRGLRICWVVFLVLWCHVLAGSSCWLLHTKCITSWRY